MTKIYYNTVAYFYNPKKKNISQMNGKVAANSSVVIFDIFATPVIKKNKLEQWLYHSRNIIETDVDLENFSVTYLKEDNYVIRKLKYVWPLNNAVDIYSPKANF